MTRWTTIAAGLALLVAAPTSALALQSTPPLETTLSGLGLAGLALLTRRSERWPLARIVSPR